jgi:hypothetical protein
MQPAISVTGGTASEDSSRTYTTKHGTTSKMDKAWERRWSGVGHGALSPYPGGGSI